MPPRAAPWLDARVRALGVSGLLPQAAALAGVVFGGPDWIAYAIVVSLAYAALILSFLGGIWWGIALRRDDRQLGLAALSVVPSLAGLAVVVATLLAGKLGVPSEHYYLWAHLALGAALLATLPVERHLRATGEAPSEWPRFRAMLSIGLAALTIAAGIAYAALTRTVTMI